nr:hydrogenase small subunit [uncultured Desulfobulbus sp.]
MDEIKINRRQALQYATALAAMFGFAGLPEPVQAALKKSNLDALPQVIYLQGLSCTGCSISLLQTANPSPLQCITEYANLSFHADLSATSGKQALELIDHFLSGGAGEYFLAIEGAIPEGMPEACKIGPKPLSSYIAEGARTAAGIIAVGTCASFGGIPAAEGNPTGAVSVPQFLEKRGIDTLLITIPGCPVHPDWVWHTITHLVKVGVPELTDHKSPKLFFGQNLHNSCPRYHFFQEEIFAKKLGDPGCLFKLGCLGPTTFADCPTRWWNDGKAWCVGANAPCIGCASPTFALKKEFPFYRTEIE